MPSNKKIALATCSKVPNLSWGDQLTWLYLQNLGIKVYPVIWDDSTINWEDFDLLIIRSVWDYVEKYQEFLNWLSSLENSGITILNPPQWLYWNLHKSYLLELQAKGWQVIPTLLLEHSEDLNTILRREKWEEAVIKPAISAGAYQTFRVSRANAASMQEPLAQILKRCPAMIQPLRKSIMEDGEYSLIFFNNNFSHAVRKRSQPGEFRVNEEYNGTLEKNGPPHSWIETAQSWLTTLETTFLYARVDIVPHTGGPELIELELVEPNLLTHLDDTDAQRFGEAILKWL